MIRRLGSLGRMTLVMVIAESIAIACYAWHWVVGVLLILGVMVLIVASSGEIAYLKTLVRILTNPRRTLSDAEDRDARQERTAILIVGSTAIAIILVAGAYLPWLRGLTP